MGLLDRVKQNQTAPPGAVGATNGPAVGTVPGATSYGATTAIPVAQTSAPVATAPPPSLSARATAAAGGELTPAFTAAKVQIHARLIEKYADQIDSSNKAGVREKILELMKAEGGTAFWEEEKQT